MKKLKAFILRALSPEYSWYTKCGIPWNHCKHKTIYTNERSGTFAVCTKCWEDSSLEELKKYYTIVYYEQQNSIHRAGFEMEHTLEHLLNCVEKEYILTKYDGTKDTINSSGLIG